MKRLLGLTLIVLLAVAALAWVNQRAIGQRLFGRAVDQRVQRDLVAVLPDGLHAFVCGSGAPLADAERAGPCIAVLAGKHGFVFDSGSGSIRKLGAMQFPFDRLVKFYPFEEINQAIHDSENGKAIKPIVRM